MDNHCKDCRYRPDNMFWADTCKKKITVIEDDEIKEARVKLKTNDYENCSFYKPSFLKILKDILLWR